MAGHCATLIHAIHGPTTKHSHLQSFQHTVLKAPGFRCVTGLCPAASQRANAVSQLMQVLQATATVLGEMWAKACRTQKSVQPSPKGQSLPCLRREVKKTTVKLVLGRQQVNSLHQQTTKARGRVAQRGGGEKKGGHTEKSGDCFNNCYLRNKQLTLGLL